MKYTIYDADGNFGGHRDTNNISVYDGDGNTYIEGSFGNDTELVDGEVTTITYTQAELDAVQAALVRSRRTGLLRDTDYVILPDAPYSAETQTAYRTYRQELRDLPSQAGFPNNVTWPAKPNQEKDICQ